LQFIENLCILFDIIQHWTGHSQWVEWVQNVQIKWHNLDLPTFSAKTTIMLTEVACVLTVITYTCCILTWKAWL